MKRKERRRRMRKERERRKRQRGKMEVAKWRQREMWRAGKCPWMLWMRRNLERYSHFRHCNNSQTLRRRVRDPLRQHYTIGRESFSLGRESLRYTLTVFIWQSKWNVNILFFGFFSQFYYYTRIPYELTAVDNLAALTTKLPFRTEVLLFLFFLFFFFVFFFHFISIFSYFSLIFLFPFSGWIVSDVFDDSAACERCWERRRELPHVVFSGN